MNVRQLFMAGLAGSLLFWGAAWGQQDPNPARASSPNQSQTVAPGSSATTENSSDTASTAKEKEKHWSGSLVDIPCMVKILKNDNQNQNASPATGSSPGVPHFMGSGFTGQAGQQPGAGGPPGAAGQGGATAPMGAPSQSANQGAATDSGMNPQQSAQIARATRIDEAAKQCTASPSTQTFGLAMSGGQVVQFDNSGNSKALEALKAVDVQPGKKIKAKVTGTMENQQTVRVASVEVKGKKGAGSGPSSGTGR